MYFVRFGKTYVNMARVNSIELTGVGVAYLYTSAPLTQDGGIDSLQPDFVKLYGDDVEALQRWLEDHSENARLPAPAPGPQPADEEPYDLPIDRP